MDIEDVGKAAQEDGFAFVEWVKEELAKTKLTPAEKAKVFMLVAKFCADFATLLFSTSVENGELLWRLCRESMDRCLKQSERDRVNLGKEVC
jgi:hypothetical protein